MAPSRVPFGLLASTLLSTLPLSQASVSSVKPAGDAVSSDSTAGASLFRSESFQLTENALERIKNTEEFAEYAHLFTFDDGQEESHSASSRDGDDCKLLPGDDLWPDKSTWEAFDDLLGGALVPIIPVASPCYKDSEYDNYDSAKCDSIVENWTTSELQYDISFLIPEGLK